LAQQCGYCHTAGHTVSYCKLLKQHQKAKEHYNRKCDFVQTQSKTAVEEPKKNKSAFAALAEDSDDEIDAKVVKQACAFPALCEIKHVEKSNAISYAVMASKPANAFAEAVQVAPKTNAKTKTKTIVTHNVSRRWVDMMSDSDYDDDDDVMSVSEISNDCW
jgi:L-rhamnose mutarotase